MAETTGRKGRSDKGKYRKNRSVTVAEAVEVDRPTIAAVEPLYHTYDAPKPEGAYFDEEAADAVIDWIESNLRHFEGRFAGQPFYLLDWQKSLIRHVFGWKRSSGYRLYRRVYVECPRKAGKSTLASAIALYLALGDDENAPQVVFAGIDKDQAGICYNAAKNILVGNQEMYDTCAVYQGNQGKRIELRENPGGWLKPVSADAKRLYGLNIHGLIFDELMTQSNRELWDALTTSSGARTQPLLFSISTAGWDQTSICFEQHELVRQVQEGSAVDESFFGVVYGAPMEADWAEESVWANSNPSLGHTVTIDFYRENCQKVKAVPAEENQFRTLYLSQWVGQETRYIPIEAWDKCNPKTKPPAKRPAFGGLDLSATTDLTAFSVVAPKKDGTLDLFSFPFLPDDGLRERERRDKAPYGQWAKEGFLTLTHGRVIDYAVLLAKILEVADLFDLKDISYDRWMADPLVQQLEGEGIAMVKVGQGYAGMSAPTKSFLKRTLEGDFNHGGDPLLRWTVGNLAVSIDPAENVKPDKAKATHRIDPVVASIMALDGYNRRGAKKRKKSIYGSAYFAGDEENQAQAVA